MVTTFAENALRQSSKERLYDRCRVGGSQSHERGHLLRALPTTGKIGKRDIDTVPLVESAPRYVQGPEPEPETVAKD